jgi:F420-non-reducing hydrogenase iron-sulfur subunit
MTNGLNSQEAKMTQESEWEPKLLGFLCRWCSYAGADLAGTSRKKYPANIRIIKVPCSGRVDSLFILKALRLGFDGVLVSGCHPGDCHYQTGNYRARRRIAITKKFLDYLGIEPQRLQARWVSASEGGKFAEVVTDVTNGLKEVGPNRLFERKNDGAKAKAESEGTARTKKG